jgi:hypothetical protein
MDEKAKQKIENNSFFLSAVVILLDREKQARDSGFWCPREPQASYEVIALFFELLPIEVIGQQGAI